MCQNKMFSSKEIDLTPLVVGHQCLFPEFLNWSTASGPCSQSIDRGGAPREDAKDVSRGEKGIISKAYSVSPNGRCKAWASRLGRCLWKLKGRSECRAASLREFCEMNVHCVEYCG